MSIKTKVMKIFVIIATVFFNNAYAQQKIILNNNMSTVIPNDAKLITRQQSINIALANFGNNKNALEGISQGNPDQRLSLNNVYAAILSHKEPVKSNYLINLKKGSDAMSRGDKEYLSALKSFDTYSVLILTDGFNDGVKISYFFAVDNISLAVITGRVIYNSADEDKANLLLNGMIQNLKFKVQ